jgi:hypothetical protein
MANTLHTWAVFAAAKESSDLDRVKLPRARLNQYRVQKVAAVNGSSPPLIGSGWSVARIESESPVDPVADGLFTLRGVTQHLHYTTAEQQADLGARSRAELEPSADTTAVLIPIRKSAAWWQLAQDRRHAHFQHTPQSAGHTTIGSPYVERVFRRLYHSRYLDPGLPYDFLTYFEFHASDAPLFERLLAELRDPERNPEWSYVEAEYEIWMTKTG